MKDPRACKRCGESKPLDSFYSFIDSKCKCVCYSSNCKVCHNVLSSQRWHGNPLYKERGRIRSRIKQSKFCKCCGVANDGSVKWGVDSSNPDKYGRKSFCLKCFDAKKEKTRQNIKRLKKLSDIRCSVRVKSARKKWMAGHREHNLKYQRAWWKKWRLENPELARAKAREQWAKADPVKRRASYKKWYDSHHDVIIQNSRRQRVRKRGAMVPESKLVTKEWFAQLCATHGNRCYYCWDAAAPISMDHLTPLSLGGKHIRENIIPSCKSCNSRKRTRTIAEWRPWIDIPLYGLELASA